MMIFFKKTPKVNLPWDVVKSGFESLYVCRSTTLVKKENVDSALEMIPKLKSNKVYPVD